MSSAALSAVHKSLAETPAGSSCACTVKVTMGLPCAHVVRGRITRKTTLEVFDFNKHWHLDRAALRQPVSISPNEPVSINVIISALIDRFYTAPFHEQVAIYEQLKATTKSGPTFAFKDPLPAKTRGRPSGAQNKPTTSAARDPSAFGYVEGSARIKNRCGVCNSFGHNARTCQQKDM